MNTHRFILTLGSNDTTADRIAWATERLCVILGRETLRFSPAKRSQPINFGLSDALFTDVVAVGFTQLEQTEFALLLKQLELEAGRTPEQRQLHPAIIPIDIDLITWDQELLKPRDIDRPYLIEGLQMLGESLF